MKRLTIHSEWLSLIEVSGPFITVPMLVKAFPQGLEAVETPRRQKLRAAYEEWREAVDEDDRLLSELHREWIRLVLTEMLEYDDESLVPASAWVGELPTVSSSEHAGSFSPDWIVRSPGHDKPRLLVSVLPPDTDLTSIQQADGWPVSLHERMVLLCRTHDVRLGLLTNGERWMLVNAPVGSMSSDASWYARLWFQEQVTLKAFQSLLGVRRCFGRAEETLEALLDESLKHHEEVTDTLGEQVRRAVEVLVQCLDQADEDRNRELLRDVKPSELYEAGLTVMMRLVFVLCAEERGLLLLGDSVYDQCYAVSTLRAQLAEDADRHGPEVLDRRHDAWARLLAVFRAVYGGIEHERLRLPALGGSLFDPDRFPFLEGRGKGTLWRGTSAAPLPIDNRTVLLLLNSLQLLEQSGGALLLSYRALDVEQIGHVYEGLLEHTVARVPRVTLGLVGSQKAKNPNIALAELESARLDGEADLIRLVTKITGRSESAIHNGMSKTVDEMLFGWVLGVCGGDTELAERIRPFANLLRTDAWENPIVYRDNSFMVTLGADRRETGTHYTPKSLTENIVTTTLEPLVYIGPAEGTPRDKWRLRSSRDLLELKVCDPAMGSGAFLVQVCRYLAEKLVEAWLHEEATGQSITVDGDAIDDLGSFEPMPSQLDERLTIARRLMAERCLYGVDVNPLAVELAKLSIWLVTLSKGRPFGFLDHNLRSGDSLLGITRLDQLTRMSMNPKSGQYQPLFFCQNVEAIVKEAIELRTRLRSTPIRDIYDVEAMARLDREARKKLESVELIADAMIGEALRWGDNTSKLDTALDVLANFAGDYLSGNEKMGEQIARQTRAALSIDLPVGKPPRKPFHWALEYPEVLLERTGFDAVVGNPPFMGGKKITGSLGIAYRSYLVAVLGGGVRGNADLCAYFVLRAFDILRNGGQCGVITTNTISQGDTREVGLDQIVAHSGTITAAVPSRKWPGKANLEISQVWFRKGDWTGARVLGDVVCEGITPYLTRKSRGTSGNPYRLVENEGKSFIGSYVLGMGFVITPEEAQELITKDLRNQDVLFPYLTGEDLNSRWDQSPSRWVINFRDWPLDEAHDDPPSPKGPPYAVDYPDCLRIVEEKVRPERTRRKPNGEFVLRTPLPQRWWHYADKRPALYKAIEGRERVLITPAVSPTTAFDFKPNNIVFAHKLIVFSLNQSSHFSILQATFHREWAWHYSSTLGGMTLNYSPTDCFETFPFPQSTHQLSEIGDTYYTHRQKIMTNAQQGLTTTYKCFHSPTKIDLDIKTLRDLHIQMDNAVAAAYGWDDIDLGHGFHQTKQGVRFTISEDARREVLQRLLELNHHRYEKEVSEGLHGKKADKKPPTSNQRKKTSNEYLAPSLFDIDPSPDTSKTDSGKAVLEFLEIKTDWSSKEEVLSGSRVPASQLQTTISELLKEGLIERQGKGSRAHYRAVKNGGDR